MIRINWRMHAHIIIIMYVGVLFQERLPESATKPKEFALVRRLVSNH